MTALPIPGEGDERDRIILAVLIALQGYDNGKTAPQVMALPQIKPFVDKYGEQRMKNVVYALEGIGLLYKNGTTQGAYYATTLRGGTFAEEMMQKLGVSQREFWDSLPKA